MELRNVRSHVGTFRKEVCVAIVCTICFFTSIRALTDSQDVYALNQLYTSLNFSTFLSRWSPIGGDPCAESWEGVACAGPNVTILNLTGLSLVGGLTPALENLTALIVLDLSNNFFSGGLPVNLPPYIQQLDLSENQFTGNIPFSYSSLNNLDILSVSNNLLSGTLVDMWDRLEMLETLDLSSNEFDGSIPQSFQALSSLTQLYIQENQFSGSINMLADLPLTNLNVSSNRLTGWIPSQLQKFASSSFAGNSFNTFPAPPPPPPHLSPPPPSAPPNSTIDLEKTSPTSRQTPESQGYLTVGKRIGIAAAALLTFMVFLLLIAFFVSRRRHKQKEEKYDPEKSWHTTFTSSWKGDRKQPLVPVREQTKESRTVVKSPPKANELEFSALKPPPLPFEDFKPENSQDYNRDNRSPEFSVLRPPPLPFENFKLGNSEESTPRAENIARKISIEAQEFTIAELQVATQSFAEENLIGEGVDAKVYKAKIADENFAVVKKLNSSINRVSDEDFLDFVWKVSHLRHPSIIRLLGYCMAHGERLLVYEFVGNGTLYESLHSDLGGNTKLPWKIRVKIALGVAKALEYLHEECKPPVIHGNLKSTNILLDEDLLPHLSDCGLMNENGLSKQFVYNAPELLSPEADKEATDTDNFGVVMLELLTGRKEVDRARPRSEQFLLRWAVPQLHDIGALEKMVDPAIEGMHAMRSVSRFADIIQRCVLTGPEFKPSMSGVRQDLERLLECDDDV